MIVATVLEASWGERAGTRGLRPVVASWKIPFSRRTDPNGGRVASCAGLRNRIAHDYDEIDPAKVHAALHDALRDLPELMRRILSFVERTQR